MKQHIDRLRQVTRKVLHHPADQLLRWQLAIRYGVGLFHVGQRQLREDRAAEMAAALTYRTIFSLIPMFVIALIVFNAFGGFGSIKTDVRTKLYDYLGLSIAIQAQAPADPPEAPPPPESSDTPDTPDTPDIPEPPSAEVAASPAAGASSDEAEQMELDHLRAALDGGEKPASAAPIEDQRQTKQRVDALLSELTDRVSNVSISGIGVWTMPLLIWAAIALVVSLEQCFNRVFRAPAGRPWHLRITIYWAVITLGPVFVALSFWMTGRLIGAAETVEVLSWGVRLLTPFASLAVTWLLLLLMYMLLPNAKVHLNPALVGSFIAAVLWEISKWGFRLYVSKAVGYSALYGSLGLVPLFLMWIYLTWQIILLGLELTYAMQTTDRRALLIAGHGDHDAPRPILDHRWMIPVAAAFARSFDTGKASAVSDVAEVLGVEGYEVDRFAAQLCKAGVLRQVERGEEGAGQFFTLARPAHRITLRELLLQAEVLSLSATPDTPGRGVLQTLHTAELEAVGDRTLDDVVAANHPPAPGESAAETEPNVGGGAVLPA